MKNKTSIVAICVMLIAVLGTAAAAQTEKGQPRQTTNGRQQNAAKTQTAEVQTTQNGYQPCSFKLKKGVPARVTFVRRIEETCGTEIAIPAYGIRRSLPLNQSVMVAFTPQKSGEFNFISGMGMLRGTIVLR